MGSTQVSLRHCGAVTLVGPLSDRCPQITESRLDKYRHCHIAPQEPSHSSTAPTSRYRATKDKIRRPEPSALYWFLPRISSSRVLLPGVLREDTPSLFHLTSLLLRCTRHVREKWQLLTFKRWSPSSRLPFSFLSILHLPPISRSTYPCVDGLGGAKPQQCYLFVLA